MILLIARLERAFGRFFGRRRHGFALTTLVLALPWFGITDPSAYAHGGEDHGEVHQPAVATAGSRRVTAQSETYELVGTLKDQRLTIYLDRFSDNAPVVDATLTVTVDGLSLPAARANDGTFSVSSPRFAGGHNAENQIDLVFNFASPAGDDLLIGTLQLPQPAVTAVPIAAGLPWLTKLANSRGPGVLVPGSLLVGACLGLMLRKPRKLLPLAASVGLVTLLMFLVTSSAFAHEGHDDAPVAAAPSDAPQRLPDGSVFLPKPTQRLLEVRTVLTKSDSAQTSVSLMGRIIADPNASGMVQSINGGRVIAPPGGLPQLGQSIKKGDVLAMVERPIISADQATLAEKTGDIDQQTELAKAKLARARLLAATGAGPRITATDAELELAGLARRRSAVRQVRSTPELLRAPVDGVIAGSKVVAGQVVQAQDVLFQVFDPHRLWIEALDYGDMSPSATTNPTALVTNGTRLKLTFRGIGRTLQQQATVVQFSVVDPPPVLNIGQAVTVLAPSGSSVAGIIVPREAIVRGSNGEALVWRHTAAERFEALPVRAEPLDASRMVVRAGVKVGDRIVVRGAELINQIR